MNAMSTFARRSATKMAATRRFTTNTVSQVESVEGVLKNMKWTDLKDNVRGVRNLLNEVKTNHALKADQQLESKVATEMKEIQQMVSNNAARAEVESRITALKKMTKQQLYA